MDTTAPEMSFLDHLEELRWRLIRSFLAIIVFAIPCGIFWQRIFDWVMLYPLRFADPKPRLIITAPAEAVMLSIKIAIAGGIICAAPVIFYQVWRFIAPGLYRKEKAVVLPAVIVSTLSFAAGIAFCYLTLPYVLQFLAQFGKGRMDPLYKMNEYLSFLLQISIAFGVIFEMPVISFVLTKLGLLTPRFLIDKFRYAVVIIFVVAAVLTPPDVFSQMLMAVPLLALYAVSILVSFTTRAKQP